ncbi:SDR family oxidoreductase [Nocardioides endophyticus]|uniref:SDR family oxidoreductase n=1 Tax=Nocardioides endophyticus TaxID=1353775 RepID=A0ABP8YJP5_9ACTN
MENRFDGKTVVITGGGSGIGAATAARFGAEGAHVVVLDIERAAATAVAESLPDSLAICADVADPSAVEQAFDEAFDRYGRIDVIFNNAGIDDKPQPLHETDIENWSRVSRINGDGFFFVLKYGIAKLLQSGGGSVVNTASTAALSGVSNISPYTFTKTGVVGLTRSAALEYADRNIRVNCVAPGGTLTPLLESFMAAQEDPVAYREATENYNPIPGFIEPNDIADAVLFLASEQARRITGHTLPVDGGVLTVGRK